MRNIIAICGFVVAIFSLTGCNKETAVLKSRSGVGVATAKVVVGDDGLTTGQRALKRREESFNDPGVIRHFYVISAHSGQVILYSTVKGKLMSSGNRLMPKTLTNKSENSEQLCQALPIRINGQTYYTLEVPRDDGTFGGSVEYLLWTDSRGVEHQHYVSGGQIVHVSSQPIQTKSIILNLEMQD